MYKDYSNIKERDSMAFRVYDLEKRKWVKDNIYMNSNDELYLIKHSLFGMIKVPLALDSNRYICHRDIMLLDKNNIRVYERDYIAAKVLKDNPDNESNEEIEYETVIGVVCYAEEFSSYIILCDEINKFFTLGSEISSEIEVIGNVFDGYFVNYKMNYE